MLSRSTLITGDAFLAIFSGFLSALALCIFFLSFQCVLAQWDAFKQDKFDVSIKEGKISVSKKFAKIVKNDKKLILFFPLHYENYKYILIMNQMEESLYSII